MKINSIQPLSLPDNPCAQDLLRALHLMIDQRFNRMDGRKMIDPILLKHKITMHGIAQAFANYNPALIATLLKELVKHGWVVTNVYEEKVYPFDAYFIPKTELPEFYAAQ